MAAYPPGIAGLRPAWLIRRIVAIPAAYATVRTMIADEMPTAVVLAGGRGRRMGGADKALLSLGGRTLLANVVDRIRPQVRAMVLNANGDAERFAAYGLEVVADTLAGFPGPLAGVLAGMRWSAWRYPGVTTMLSVPADTPFLPGDLVARLMAGRTTAAIACASSGGRTHPVVAVWPVASADALEAALRSGAGRVDAWQAGQGVVAVAFEGAQGFLNVNTPEDLRAAERVLG
jgi:molybdopterin-guanine dinucleotide biosynthesis protein A